MAEAAWKARLLHRVDGACGFLYNAGENLKRVEAIFGSPVAPVAGMPWPASWVAGLRDKHVRAMQSLMEASENLESAVVLTQVAEILALHGGNVNDPSVPLPSIEPLAQAEPKVHGAMPSVRTCGAEAEDASKFAEWCRGYLSTAIALVDASGIPDYLLTAALEFRSACTALTATMQATQTALGEANLARQILTSS